MFSRIYLVGAISLALVGCAKNSSSSSSDILSTRPMPDMSAVQEAELDITDGDASSSLYLTADDRDHNRTPLYISYADTQNGSLFQPTLKENPTTDGTGGLLRLAEHGNLNDFSLAYVQDEINARGLRTAREIAYVEKTALRDFTRGSVWVVSVKDTDWQYTLLVKLKRGFAPIPNYNEVHGAKVTIQYKVLEYHAL